MTIEQLVQESLRAVDSPNSGSITFTLSAATICDIYWYAQGKAVKEVCDKHSAIMRDARAKAKGLRYHTMAESILPKSDIIYDGRYADAEEFGMVEIELNKVK